MTYYDTLGVSRLAEDAVIRAAYRALMRMYHPDTNTNLEAQARVREINAAYAVLGNRSKRAEYDALPNLFDEPTPPEQPEFTSPQRSRPPLRNLGIAAISLLLVTSLAVVALPGLQQPFRSQQASRTAVKGKPGILVPVASGAKPPTIRTDASSIPAASAHAPALVSKSPAPSPTPPLALAKPVSLPEPKPKISMAASKKPASPTDVRIAKAAAIAAEIPTPARGAEAAMRKSAPAADEARTSAATQVAASCDSGGSSVPAGECVNDRKEQIQRIATNFLRQSLEHSDWHKQQLLLSAQNRAIYSRASCHSDECVIDAYMRQMRDTSVIMQGGTPNQ